MSMLFNIPNYADLFGNIDFKEGDESRSVYSPAAYLTDLLQMLDDEFDTDSIDFDSRRSDIKEIDLDAENTTTLIPHLDIVNEVLAKQIDAGLYDTQAALEKEVFSNLENAAYPFNMPFSLDNEKLKNHLSHLGISAHELRRLFATTTDNYTIVAREYLGLSEVEWAHVLEPTEPVTSDFVAPFYGEDDAGNFISNMSTVTNFMEATDLEAQEMLELLYQRLYINPSDHADVEDGRQNFYINTGTSNGIGYVTLTTDETALEWSDGNAVPIEWFDRTSRFVRLAQKTGLSFTELDHILRHCCQDENGTPTLSEETLVYVAQVIYIHKILEQSIDAVVAILSKLSFMGRTNEDLPQDQFNRIFNLPCVSIDEKYFHIDTETGTLPNQYGDTTYHTYTPIEYFEDLFDDDNDTYRQRLRHALGFTETDLINITERLEFEEVADSSLWEKNDDLSQWQLLNVLYRIHALSNALDVHFLELFILFDLLEQDPFIGRTDPQTYFVYHQPSTQNCFEILMAPVSHENHSISDQLWLFESLMALTKWMKEFGYSTEMLWAIVNGAAMTDQAEEEQNAQDLALYNTLLQSFKAVEMQPDSLAEALGDARASHFAFNLMRSHQKETQGSKETSKPPYHCKGAHRKRTNYKKHSRHKKLGMHHLPSSMHHRSSMSAMATAEQGMYQPLAAKEQQHLLMAYEPRKIQALTEDFIQQLTTVHDYEFMDLQLERKLQEKIVKNLVNHQVIDGTGKILTQNWVDGQFPSVYDFQLEFDFSQRHQAIFEIIQGIYEEVAAAQLEADDTIEVQIFKSDFETLGLSAAEIRELYDTLIYNGYIDEQGFVTDVDMFSGVGGANTLVLDTGLEALTDKVHHLLAKQVDKFHASKVQLNAQMFDGLELDKTALKDLIRNLQMNRYIDKHMFVLDKMRIVTEQPKTMEVALQFYPHREAILNVLRDAIATDKTTWLQLDQTELGKLTAMTVSQWVYADLQGEYLDGNQLKSDTHAFFKEEGNREQLGLRAYFEGEGSAIVFDHIVGIVNYADQYRLQNEKLKALDFNAEEIQALKQNLTAIDVLDEQGLLKADRIPFFLVPENAAAFRIPAFEDYDLEVFFQIYDIAKAINDTVNAVDQALKDYTDAQQAVIIDQLQGILGIDADAVKALSEEIFKTEDNLHFVWLQPLLEAANALGQLDALPENMHYTQAVKRIRQLALLIKQQRLDINEIKIALDDQELVAKFPEDLILPDDSDGKSITSVNTLLETDEFIYIFNGSDYWVYLAEDYTLIDKKAIDLSNEDDQDLVDLQKEDEALQKRLKEAPIRQLFEAEDLSQIDAAFIVRGASPTETRHGTWVIVSDTSHYVRYANSDRWDRRDNNFGQVDNDFDNLEMIDSAYVDSEGRLFLFANDKYVRYSTVGSSLTSDLTVDQGYPKSIAEDWNNENLPIQLPESFARDLGPMFDGVDDYSYAFLGDTYVSSEDGQMRPVATKWGHREYNFGHPTHIDAALASGGNYYLFLDNKVAKYAGSLELANLRPEEGYPKGIHEEFTDLPDEFVAGIDAALGSWDDRTYLFRDDDYVSISTDADGNRTTSDTADIRSQWGKVANDIADSGTVNAAFVGLDGYTYLFSGAQYVRYSSSDYSQVDDGFPRNIAEDWEGLETVTAAVVLGNKTYLFGTDENSDAVYVRYSTLHKQEDDYLEVDEDDPNARVIETVLANRPDVDEIEVFPAAVNDDFWSLPDSVTGEHGNVQIDAVMNGPDGKVYLFYRDSEENTESEDSESTEYTYYYIEHDHTNRWWSEPKVLSEQWDRTVNGLENERVVAALMGTDGKTYLFYGNKYLRFSDDELRNVDNGYPRLTRKFWGKVRNNIERTGKVDAALIVESRWEEQDDNGQLVDMTANHTYLFSGDQFFRYLHENNEEEPYTYDTVEQGYPRSIHRLQEEPRFRGLKTTFPHGIDAAFADQRQVYLFKGDSLYVVIGDEDNYKQYGDEDDTRFANVQAATQESGVNYLLISDSDSETNLWYKVNHLEDMTLTTVEAVPRTVQRAENLLADRAVDATNVNAVLHGSDGKRYVFAGSRYYDVELEDDFPIEEVWGRSRNPIYDQETVDAAFVGRDGITYVFSGEWFVQYDGETYVGQTVTYPPRRISDKWRGLNNVALAYVWQEDTYLFERPDRDGNFRYLHYTKDSYEQLVPVYQGNLNLWGIPVDYLQDGFTTIDAIFVHEENLIFISDQKFLSFNLNSENWGFPQPLDVLYPDIPFNKTDFQTLTSGFVGKDGTVYFFSQESYVAYDNNRDSWTAVTDIKEDWGLQENILRDGVDVAWVNPSDRTTYLFAGDSYVRYSGNDYRYVDEGYPKEIATYLCDEPAFAFMTKEFQQHLDELESNYDGETPFFSGLLDNGRCLYFFTDNTVFTGSPNKYIVYDIDGLGQVENNFTQGGYVDAAFVTEGVDSEGIETYVTYLFSGEQYIRYTIEQEMADNHRGDYYRYIDEGYPKILGESFLAEEALNLAELPEDYRNGIDAAFYSTDLGLVLFNETHYLHIDTVAATTQGSINEVWGNLNNAFTSESGSQTIDGAYVDAAGRLLVFKGQQFVRYSDTAELFALNPYDEPRYVDTEFPQDIDEIWPQLDASILTDTGVDTIFKFEDEIYFHTGTDFVKYDLDLSDHDDAKPVQVLAYRWGEWSDYLLSDIQAITRFKDLNQRFTGGELTLTELVSGANGQVSEPYMHIAAIFGFEKEEVRWVKQRNAFLAEQVNIVEEDFQLELVLRLYDILATTQRLRVDVSALYNDVWLKLYDRSNLSIRDAASGAYDLLVSVDCNNNYETLVKQITNEINTIKRDALVPYVIGQDNNITTPRQLYQKLLIDIQMESCAETSRIVEATAAVQLYIHRYFMNLEQLDLNATDQELLKATLKERWEWMQNYRVWEANRKVFLYPENYIRPELRDQDYKSAAFEALEASLSQGQLTEEFIESAYFTYLDAFTEVSELKIAGGYVYDDASSGNNNKVLVLFGRTRTDPTRFYYRFGTFVGGASAKAVWQPWEEVKITIDATHVQPIYAFNRVFVFWAVVEDVVDEASTAIVSEENYASEDVKQEIKIYYSFYNLNETWSQPQLLQTTFDDVPTLQFSKYLANVDVFVENASKIIQNGETHNYENIYISVRYYTSDTYSSNTSTYAGPNYKAFNLTPELYSQEASVQSIENRGQTLFNQLFPNEGRIEEDNVVMLNYSNNSMDGPWFAYNHNGCGFLIKPDATSLSSNTALSLLSTKQDDNANVGIFWATSESSALTDILASASITAAVQAFAGGDIYYFLDNGQYVAVSADGSTITEEPSKISNRWGIQNNTEMAAQGKVDSAFVIDATTYLTLNNQVYEYQGAAYKVLDPETIDETIDTDEPYDISLLSVADAKLNGWTEIDAAFTTSIEGTSINVWFNNTNDTALINNGSTSSTSAITEVFGLPIGLVDTLTTVVFFPKAAGSDDYVLHLIGDNNSVSQYTSYQLSDDGNTIVASISDSNYDASTLLKSIFNDSLEVNGNVASPDGIIGIDGGLWITNSAGSDAERTYRYAKYELDSETSEYNPVVNVSMTQSEIEDTDTELDLSNLPAPFDTLSDSERSTLLWQSGVSYTDAAGLTHHILFYGDGTAKSWSQTEVDGTTFSLTEHGAIATSITAALLTPTNTLVIITDATNYHLFDHSLTPSELWTQLSSDTTASGLVQNLDLSVYLTDNVPDNIIWSGNQIDAAFIGANGLGTTGDLYLFSGNAYMRYSLSYRASMANLLTATPVTGYPKHIDTNPEGFPAWTQIDAAFTAPVADETGTFVSYLFNNEAQKYYRSDNSLPADPSDMTEYSDTTGIWGNVQTNLQSREQVDAAYVADGYLYLISETEYYRYTLGSSTDNEPIPRFIDSGYPLNYYVTSDTDGAVNQAWRIKDLKENLETLYQAYYWLLYSIDRRTLSNAISTLTVAYTNLQTATTSGEIENVITYLKVAINGLSGLNGSTLSVYWFASPYAKTLSTGTYADTLQGIVNDLEYVITPRIMTGSIDAAFTLSSEDADNNTHYYVYLFSGTEYYRLSQNVPEAENIGVSISISGSWGNMPSDIRSDGLTAALNYANTDGSNITAEKLYLIQGNSFLAYDILANEYPFELDSTTYEVIRLTSSTAEQLNQILFAGGIAQLLQMSTQEINESPTISTDGSSPDNIHIDSTWVSSVPINSHLDFNSANGLYYWEVFFHAPFLIAQALNADQQFDYAKEWYEYIFDPTAVSDYWQFLPFLAVDPQALIDTLNNDLANFDAIASADSGDENSTIYAVQQALNSLDDKLGGYQSVFLGQRDLKKYEAEVQASLAEGETWESLENIDSWSTVATLQTNVEALDTEPGNSNSTLLVTWRSEMLEVVEMIKKLYYRLDLMSNYDAQLSIYLADPFDPHAIAALRPLAYRKAIVMRYIDNLLDWGDMLFRQYTRESINEARMLYILAYDILGEKPKNMGRVVLENTTTYSGIIDNPYYSGSEDYDFLIEMENENDGYFSEQSLSFAATQFDTITNPYFYLPENELFTEYWTRVEDRLGKIRACLNIDGVAQPLPLFQPPIDPMALVNAVAGGGGVAAAVAMAASAATVPNHRFTSLMAKARDLVSRLKSLGDTLLSTLEKKDAEELSLLQSKQEAIILDMTTLIKTKQIEEAKESLKNLQETQKGAQEQLTHYETLITNGYLSEEQKQIELMNTSVILNHIVGAGRLAAAVVAMFPQVHIGPFCIGSTTGGEALSKALSFGAEGLQTEAEALSMAGEVAGIVAQLKRTQQDWELQKKMATSEIEQLNYQIAAQERRIAIAQQELLLHQKEIENHESIAEFMKSKFSNLELYSWMSGQLSGLFFQTYKLAHDYAKQAEQALIFEKGLEARQVNYINGMYWDSQKQGLLSGTQLELDLDRLEKAYLEKDSRRFEITKDISLLELDPIALLDLKTKGFCQFRLSEALFDYDFPGHYNRQIKTVSLAFDVGEGQKVNATLTQLSSKLVLDTDIKAVKHLMDPSNEPTSNVRANWRANQQVALSHVDQYTENSGMFELNFGDERYLPFEGTGAVSNWRLELNGKKGSYNPADLLDVTIKLRYTAQQGGNRFANEIKGLLKPYDASSFFDLAYNFPDEWAALTAGDVDEIEISLTQSMFPNMSSSKIMGLFTRYEYENGQGGATFIINDNLQVPHNTLLRPSTLSVGQRGSVWTLSLQGDRNTLKNAEMVMVYKAKV